jgi:hypothetical protein
MTSGRRTFDGKRRDVNKARHKPGCIKISPMLERALFLRRHTKALHAIVSLRARERLKPSQRRDKVGLREGGDGLGVRCGAGLVEGANFSAIACLGGSSCRTGSRSDPQFLSRLACWVRPPARRKPNATTAAPQSGAVAALSIWESCRAASRVLRLALPQASTTRARR